MVEYIYDAWGNSKENSYSTGFVLGYENERDYEGSFVFFDGGIKSID